MSFLKVSYFVDKDFSTLDKTLISMDSLMMGMENSIAAMKTDSVQLRMESENCVEIVEILKRIEHTTADQ